MQLISLHSGLNSLERLLHLLRPRPQLLHLPDEGHVGPRLPVPVPPLPPGQVPVARAGVHPPFLRPVHLHHAVSCNTRQYWSPPDHPDLSLNSPMSGGCCGPAGPEDLILLTGPCLGRSAVRLRPRLSGDAVPCLLLPPGNSGDTLLLAPG